MLRDAVPDVFWDAIRALDWYNKRFGLGFPDLMHMLRTVVEFDSDHFRRLAQEVWGTGGYNAGQPAALAEATREDIRVTTALLGERWTGEAQQGFAAAMNDVHGLLGEIPKVSQQLGTEIMVLVEDMEFTVSEVCEIVLGALGLIFGLAVTATGVAALIGMIVMLLSAALLAWTTFGERAVAVQKFADKLAEDINKRMPYLPDSALIPPLGVESWRPKTADPNT